MKESSNPQKAPLRVEIRGRIPDSVDIVSEAVAGLFVTVLAAIGEVLVACKDWLVSAIHPR